MANPDTPTRDRAIYRRESRAAYFASLWVHAWDESVHFWGTNRKQLVIQLSMLALGAHGWALIRGWEYALNEFVLGIAITTGAPVGAALLLYLWGVAKAPYQLHRRHQALLISALPVIDGDLRDKVVALGAQLGRFVAERKSGNTSLNGVTTSVFALEYERIQEQMNPEIARQKDRSVRAYWSATMDQYDQKFAPSVMKIARDLRLLGITDTRLEKYPRGLDEVQAVAGALEDSLSRLPIDKPDPLSALHEANTKLQNRIAELEESRRGRRLSEPQKAEIIRTTAAWIQGFEPPRKDGELVEVMVIAVGHEQETIDYRNDFVAALEAAGYDTLVTEWKAGDPECAQFRGSVTVLTDDKVNIFRPVLIEALRLAGVPHKLAPYPQIWERNKARPGTVLKRRWDSGEPPKAYLVIGQR